MITLRFCHISFISQNCLGGLIYHRLRQRFLSPTINTLVRGEDYYKLCTGLEHYLTSDPVILKKEPIPTLLIDDIRVLFPHESSPEQAIKAWRRRCKRVNYRRLFFLATTWDFNGDSDLVESFLDLSGPKIVFAPANSQNNDPRLVRLKGLFSVDEAELPTPNPFINDTGGIKVYFETQCDLYRIIRREIKAYRRQTRVRSSRR